MQRPQPSHEQGVGVSTMPMNHPEHPCAEPSRRDYSHSGAPRLGYSAQLSCRPEYILHRQSPIRSKVHKYKFLNDAPRKITERTVYRRITDGNRACLTPSMPDANACLTPSTHGACSSDLLLSVRVTEGCSREITILDEYVDQVRVPAGVPR